MKLLEMVENLTAKFEVMQRDLYDQKVMMRQQSIMKSRQGNSTKSVGKLAPRGSKYAELFESVSYLQIILFNLYL